jgi:hypothetical protein
MKDQRRCILADPTLCIFNKIVKDSILKTLLELFCEANSHRNHLLKKFMFVGSSIFSKGLTRRRCKWLPNALFCHHIAQKIKPSHADPPGTNGSCSSKWVFDEKTSDPVLSKDQILPFCAQDLVWLRA